MTEFYVKVDPDSDSFEIRTDTITRIKLESKAENGKANTELIAELGKILGNKPGIVSGHKSRRKKIMIDMPEKEIFEKLEEAENG